VVKVLSGALRALLRTRSGNPFISSSSQPLAIDVLRQHPFDLLTVWVDAETTGVRSRG